MAPAVWVRLLAGWILMTIDSFGPCGEEEPCKEISHVAGKRKRKCF